MVFGSPVCHSLSLPSLFFSIHVHTCIRYNVYETRLYLLGQSHHGLGWDGWFGRLWRRDAPVQWPQPPPGPDDKQVGRNFTAVCILVQQHTQWCNPSLNYYYSYIYGKIQSQTMRNNTITIMTYSIHSSPKRKLLHPTRDPTIPPRVHSYVYYIVFVIYGVVQILYNLKELFWNKRTFRINLKMYVFL